jgi:predicted nuclease of predicted toxin-antitoxin system
MTNGRMRRAITSPLMNLYLDDNMIKGALVARLRRAGHTVVVPADVGLSGAWDPSHLLQAVQQNLALVTRNHDDFKELHLLVQATRGQHTGMLVVRDDNDPRRDMKDGDISRAIANLEAAGAPIINEFHILNHWR